jgi:hypothetical protein
MPKRSGECIASEALAAHEKDEIVSSARRNGTRITAQVDISQTDARRLKLVRGRVTLGECIRQLRYHAADVFANQAFSGTQLAVCTHAPGVMPQACKELPRMT